jgi:hypothetical protein
MVSNEEGFIGFIAERYFFKFSFIQNSLEIRNVVLQEINYSTSIIKIINDFKDIPQANSMVILSQLQLINNALFISNDIGLFSLITMIIGFKQQITFDNLLCENNSII